MDGLLPIESVPDGKNNHWYFVLEMSNVVIVSSVRSFPRAIHTTVWYAGPNKVYWSPPEAAVGVHIVMQYHMLRPRSSL